MIKSFLLAALAVLSLNLTSVSAQDHSVAHEWSEVMLEAIRSDLARPTMHARNLHHVSVVMYDAWAAYDSIANPYFLGQTHGGFEVPFECQAGVADLQAAQEEALSYAAYRLLVHRFADSPGVGLANFLFNNLMSELGYDTGYLGTDYENGTPADLGNYLAEQMIAFGLQDGAHESDEYNNQYWTATNPNLDPNVPGNPSIIDPNAYQPLALEDCTGQTQTGCVDNFLSPEWGEVYPFSLTPEDKTDYDVGDYVWQVYKDPGTPPLIDPMTPSGIEDLYKWGFSLVSVWSSHLDPEDETLWDISPNAIGNIPLESFPTTFEDYDQFYNFFDGGDTSPGYSANPVTGEAYAEQMVKRSDYARVLAEFWADGPDSETPPGHWFTLMNYVNYHPEVDKRWEGEGQLLSDLEWDVKTYFTLGGALHDAAIAAWSIKGYYNYLRPVSAIRYMADQGQSTDPLAASYDPAGIPLIPGYIELVEMGDDLAGVLDENVGKIKIYAWRGPDFIDNPFIEYAGVGWILAENWWPYQRPSFVTPPFAGYVSGHSTFSRAAAECITRMTGSPYFPGGMGVFDCEQNQFLVFEEGPTETIQLQWASYRDASDQCSLSRIWGGIHPPADDIPGRLIGYDIGHAAFELVDAFATGEGRAYITERTPSVDVVNDALNMGSFSYTVTFSELMDQNSTPVMQFTNDDPSATLAANWEGWDNAFTYTWTFDVSDINISQTGINVKISGAVSAAGVEQKAGLFGNAFAVDTRNPVLTVLSSADVISDVTVGEGTYFLTLTYDEAMNTAVQPVVTYPMEDASAVLTQNAALGMWLDPMTFQAAFDVADGNTDLPAVDVATSTAQDAAGNPQTITLDLDWINIAQRNPEITGVVASSALVVDATAASTVMVDVTFDEEMDTGIAPMLTFTSEDPTASLVWEEALSAWTDNMTYQFVFTAMDANQTLASVDADIHAGSDLDGNLNVASMNAALLSVDTENPSAEAQIVSSTWVSDVHTGAAGFGLDITFSEAMDTDTNPVVTYPEGDLSATLNGATSTWVDVFTYHVDYTVFDTGVEIEAIDVNVSAAADAAGNTSVDADFVDAFSIDNLNPTATLTSANTYVVNGYYSGDAGFSLFVVFSEAMDAASSVTVGFPVEDPITNGLTHNPGASGWLNSVTYQVAYDVATVFAADYLYDIDLHLSAATDLRGNVMEEQLLVDFFDMTNPALSVADWTGAALQVYPNPAVKGEHLNVTASESGMLNLELLDTSGRLVYTQTETAAVGNTLTLPTTGLSAGMYFLRATVNGRVSTLAVELR